MRNSVLVKGQGLRVVLYIFYYKTQATNQHGVSY